MIKSNLKTVYRLLESRPDSYNVWYQQGDILRERGLWEEALLSYSLTIELYLITLMTIMLGTGGEWY
jgi:hypothetical protein